MLYEGGSKIIIIIYYSKFNYINYSLQLVCHTRFHHIPSRSDGRCKPATSTVDEGSEGELQDCRSRSQSPWYAASPAAEWRIL